MVEALIVFIVCTPIGMLIGLYQFYNRGRMPCIDTNNVDNRSVVAVEG